MPAALSQFSCPGSPIALVKPLLAGYSRKPFSSQPDLRAFAMFNNKSLLCIALLLTPLCSTTASADPADARKHLDRAQHFLSSGDSKSASIELRNAVREAPEDADIRVELGRLYLKAQAYPAAAKELSKALQLGAARSTTLPPLAQALSAAGQQQAVIDLLAGESNLSPRLLTLRAQAALAVGKLDDAGRDFAATLAMDPEQETALLGMARMEILSGKENDAKGWIRRAISAAPDSPRPWQMLGDLEIKQQQTAKALSSYRTALKLDPESAEIGLRTAALLFDRGEPDAADELLAPLLARSPDNPALQLLSAAIRLKQGKTEQAARILDPLVARYPDNASATLYLGQAMLQQKNYERAIELAQRFQALRPSDPKGVLLLGLAHARGGSAEQGRRLLEPLLAQLPRSPELLTTLRIAATRQGDYQKASEYESRLASATQASEQLGEVLQQLRDGEHDSAMEMLGKTAELYPDLYQARLLQYRELIRAGQFSDAAATARELIRLLPKNASMQLLLGIALAGEKDYPAAQKAIEKAWRGNPGSPVVGHRLAVLLRIQGQPDKAETIYQQILAKHPDHAESMIRLAQLRFASGNRQAGLDYLKKAVDAAPGELRPRNLLSQALFQSGDLQQALEVLQEVQERFDTDPAYVKRLLRLQMALQDWSAAMETARLLLSLQPQTALAHLHLAEIHGNIGDRDAMTRELEQALALDGPSGISSRQLLQLAALSGDLGTAQSLLEALRTQLPQDEELAAALSALAIRQQRYDDALAINIEMQERYPDEPRWLVAETKTLYQAGRSDAGARRLREALQRFPDAPGLKMLSAASALKEQDQQQAISQYLQVIETQPNNITALNNLAWLSKETDPRQALAYSQRALRLSRHPQVLDTYGMVLLANGRNDDAIKILRLAAKRAAGNTDIQLHLARALLTADQRQQAEPILEKLAASKLPSEQAQQVQQLLQQP